MAEFVPSDERLASPLGVNLRSKEMFGAGGEVR